MAFLNTRKPSTRRGKKILQTKEPLIYENTKRTLVIKGNNCKKTTWQVLQDMTKFKKHFTVPYRQKNNILPFEDITKIESFSRKEDASLFVVGGDTKKRPKNIIFGSLHDHHLLDMFEFGVESFRGFSDIKGQTIDGGCKPILVFNGEEFETDSVLRRLRIFFIDFLRGEIVDEISIENLQHVIFFTLNGNIISVRNYKIGLKITENHVPGVVLSEIGPAVDFSRRRVHLAEDDFYDRTTRRPKQAKKKTVKNVSLDVFGTKLGRVHMERQDYSKLNYKKPKALKRKFGGK